MIFTNRLPRQRFDVSGHDRIHAGRGRGTSNRRRFVAASIENQQLLAGTNLGKKLMHCFQ